MADYNGMTDEDVAGLEDALMSGNFDTSAMDVVPSDEKVNTEDTNTDDESGDEGDTTTDPVEGEKDTADDASEGDSEGNTQAGETNDADADDEVNDANDTPDIKDGEDADTEDKTDDVDGDDADTNGDGDGDDQDNAGIDVEEYNKLKEFYSKLTETEFMVNGKPTKGMAKVEDLIKAQQKAGGLNEKFKVVKELKPFLAPLKERGMLQDPAKFELAMQIIDGDKEALKHFIKEQGIDPITDLELDEINYEAKNTLTSKEELLFDDAMDTAKQYGVGDKFASTVLNDWDADSRMEFLGSPEKAAMISSALSEQISNGLYDEVMGEVALMEAKDVAGTFSSLNSIAKYNAASGVVNERNAAKYAAEQAKSEKAAKVATKSKAKVAEEKAAIEKKRKDAEYAKKLAEKERKTSEARKKASAVSKKKPKEIASQKADPYSLEGDDLDALVNGLMEEFR